MTNIAKYNTYKGISTTLTFGTPITTMLCIGEEFIKTPATSISAVGVVVILIICFFLKDKIADNIKMPSGMVLCIMGFTICVLMHNIIDPMMYVFGISGVVCAIDTVTFRSFYKHIELLFPPQAATYKRFGFYGTRQTTIDKLTEVNANES